MTALIVIGLLIAATWFLAAKGRKTRLQEAAQAPAASTSTLRPPPRENKLALAVESARKAAREDFEYREREKDKAVDLKSAESHLSELRDYLKKADADRAVGKFIEKTRHFDSWLTHKDQPLTYLVDEGFTISDAYRQRATEPKGDAPETWGFKLTHRGLTHTYRVEERRGYSFVDDDVARRGTFEVLSEDGEVVFRIPVTYYYGEHSGHYEASLYGLELCKSVDWLVDAVILVETMDAHTMAAFKERNREDAVRRASQTMSVPK